MLVTIAKHFTFDAAHSLPFMPEGHKCRRLHGHTYELEVQLMGHPDDNGILVDYGIMENICAPVLVALDHQHLNEVPGLKNPTTENLVAYCIERLAPAFRGCAGVQSIAIRISESSTTWAEGHAPVPR